MSFYIMNHDGHLLECTDTRPTEDYLREWAETCYCDVWVIEGERYSISYDRPDPSFVRIDNEPS